MNLDLNQVVDGLLAWDYTITYGGRTVATRPLSLGDLGLLRQKATALKDTLAAKDDAAATAATIDLLSGLFAEPAESVLPWLQTFPPQHLAVAVFGILGYVKEVMRKNSQAVASLTGATAKIPSPQSGSSTPSCSTSPAAP